MQCKMEWDCRSWKYETQIYSPKFDETKFNAIARNLENNYSFIDADIEIKSQGVKNSEILTSKVLFERNYKGDRFVKIYLLYYR